MFELIFPDTTTPTKSDYFTGPVAQGTNPYNQNTNPAAWAAFENAKPPTYMDSTGGAGVGANLLQGAMNPQFLGGIANLVGAIKGTTIQNQNDNQALYAAMQAEQKRQQNTIMITGALIVLVIVGFFIFKK